MNNKIKRTIIGTILGFMIGWFILDLFGGFMFIGGGTTLYKIIEIQTWINEMFAPMIIIGWILESIFFSIIGGIIGNKSIKENASELETEGQNKKILLIFVIFLIIFIGYNAITFIYAQTAKNKVAIGQLKSYKCFTACPHVQINYGNKEASPMGPYRENESKILKECEAACKEKYFPIDLRETGYSSPINYEDIKTCYRYDGKENFDTCVMGLIKKYSYITDLTESNLSANYTIKELKIQNINCEEDNITVWIKKYGCDDRTWGDQFELMLVDISNNMMREIKGFNYNQREGGTCGVESYEIKPNKYRLNSSVQKVGVFWNGELKDEKLCQ